MTAINYGDAVFVLSLAHNKYLTVERSGEVDATRRFPGDFEALTVEGGPEGTPISLKDGRITLKSAHNKYITITLAGVPLANRDHADYTETFIIVDAQNPNNEEQLTTEQTVCLITHTGKRLAAEPDGKVGASKDNWDYSWDFFRFTIAYDPTMQGSRGIAGGMIGTSPQVAPKPKSNLRTEGVQIIQPKPSQQFDDNDFDLPQPQPQQHVDPMLERSAPKVQQRAPVNDNLFDLTNGLVDLSLSEKQRQEQQAPKPTPVTLGELSKNQPPRQPPQVNTQPQYVNQTYQNYQQPYYPPQPQQPYYPQQQQYQPQYQQNQPMYQYPPQQQRTLPPLSPQQPQKPQQSPNQFEDDFADWGLPTTHHTSVNPFDDPFADFLGENKKTAPPPYSATQTPNDDFEFDLKPPTPKTPSSPTQQQPQRRITPTTPPSPTTTQRIEQRPSPQKQVLQKSPSSKNSPVKRRFEFRVGIQPNYLFRVGIFDEKNELIYKVQMRLEVRTEINDSNNKAVALISREALHIHPTFAIATTRGRIGLCKQRFKMTERKFNYQIISTGQFIKMSGDFGSTFVIKKNERQIGSIQTKQKGYILNLEALPSDIFHVLCQTLIMMEQRYLSDGVIIVK